MNETADSSRSGQAAGGPDSEEAAWIAAAQQGSAEAFERLYRLHVGKVYAICLRLSADPIEAESLTQDAFVRAWQKLSSFSGAGPFGAWLRRLTVNVVIEDRRAAGRRSRLVTSWPDLEELERDVGGKAGASSGAIPGWRPASGGSADANIDLERAIAALPFGARVAFVMHDVIGFPHHEIAEILGLAAGTVKAQLHRARRLLRRSLGDRQEVTGT